MSIKILHIIVFCVITEVDSFYDVDGEKVHTMERYNTDDFCACCSYRIDSVKAELVEYKLFRQESFKQQAVALS